VPGSEASPTMTAANIHTNDAILYFDAADSSIKYDKA